MTEKDQLAVGRYDPGAVRSDMLAPRLQLVLPVRSQVGPRGQQSGLVVGNHGPSFQLGLVSVRRAERDRDGLAGATAA